MFLHLNQHLSILRLTRAGRHRNLSRGKEFTRGDIELPLVTRALKRVADKPSAGEGAPHVRASVPHRVDVSVFLNEDDRDPFGKGQTDGVFLKLRFVL